MVQSPSATFITGGAGMQEEPSEATATEAEEGRESKVSDPQAAVERDPSPLLR